MKFKENIDRTHWNNPPLEKYNKLANSYLKDAVELADRLCKLLGWGEITVTDYYRPENKASYHSILQAADVRTHDKPRLFLTMMNALDIMFRQAGSNIQFYTHKDLWGTPDEHIHIAYKDGALDKIREELRKKV